MICERCGSKNISLQSIKIIRDTQSVRYIYPVCNECIRDIVKFIELPPDFNRHGFNLNSYEQSKECDTRYNRGYAKEERKNE